LVGGAGSVTRFRPDLRRHAAANTAWTGRWNGPHETPRPHARRTRHRVPCHRDECLCWIKLPTRRAIVVDRNRNHALARACRPTSSADASPDAGSRPNSNWRRTGILSTRVARREPTAGRASTPRARASQSKSRRVRCVTEPTRDRASEWTITLARTVLTSPRIWRDR
jgi:hypothetical protein